MKRFYVFTVLVLFLVGCGSSSTPEVSDAPVVSQPAAGITFIGGTSSSQTTESPADSAPVIELSKVTAPKVDQPVDAVIPTQVPFNWSFSVPEPILPELPKNFDIKKGTQNFSELLSKTSPLRDYNWVFNTSYPKPPGTADLDRLVANGFKRVVYVTNIRCEAAIREYLRRGVAYYPDDAHQLQIEYLLVPMKDYHDTTDPRVIYSPGSPNPIGNLVVLFYAPVDKEEYGYSYCFSN